MGQNSQQRRAAKQRRQSERDRYRSARPSNPSSSSSASWSSWSQPGLDDLETHDLVRWGSRASYGPSLDEDLREQIIARLVMSSSNGEAPDRVARESIVDLLAARWNGGWLPLDVLHAVRREFSQKLARLAAEIVLDDASLRSPDRPVAWDQQMSAVGTTATSRFVASVSAVERWRRIEKTTLADALRAALQIMGFIGLLPRVPVVLDPPSDWARRAAAPGRCSADAGAVDARVVDKIRALLAKAEGTDFPAEAEAFISKAQELMSRHAIDTAMLTNDRPHELGSEVRSRRIHVDNPYAVEKAQLLGAVAVSNSGRVVWDEQFGWATVVGFPVDLDLIELLFTSLLIQLTRAMGDAARNGGRSKSPAFRRAFVLSYAARILERLTEAQHHARDEAAQQYGTALVPVMAARAEAVDQITEQIFPRMRESRIRQVDAQGWRAGRLAADMATLQSGSGMIDG